MQAIAARFLAPGTAAVIRVVLAKATVDMLTGGLDSQSAASRRSLLLGRPKHRQANPRRPAGKIGYARNTTHMPVCAVRFERVLLDG
jgi:hypothetical protein